MIILDENIAESQRQALEKARLHVQLIGRDIGEKGIQDREQIIPLLHTLRQPVLFTRDEGFYDRRLTHKRYCLVCVCVDAAKTASFIRRFLRQRAFNTKANRLGNVVRLSEVGLRLWRFGKEKELLLKWDDK
jgi:hypothetical protein